MECGPEGATACQADHEQLQVPSFATICLIVGLCVNSHGSALTVRHVFLNVEVASFAHFHSDDKTCCILVSVGLDARRTL